MNIFRAPEGLSCVVWNQSQSTLIVTIDGVSLHIDEAKRRADLPRAIRDVVGTIEYQLPFSLFLTLAWIEHHHGILPPDQELSIAQTLGVIWERISPSEEKSVEEVLLTGVTDFYQYAPHQPWRRARWLIKLGTSVWKLRGKAAQPWAILPIDLWEDLLNKPEVITFPALAGWCCPRTLPISYAETIELTADAYLDWISLASGPTVPPKILRPNGLGDPTESPLAMSDHTHALPVHRAGLFYETARTLLLGQQRPGPRYIKQLLQIDMPKDILPEIEGWGIKSLVVIPEHDGLWCSIIDDSNASVAAAWWEAAPQTAQYAPLTIAPAFWVCLHVILAALWFDLCQESIKIEGSSDQRGTHTSLVHPMRNKKREVMLPPHQYTSQKINRIEWIAELDRIQLQNTVLLGNSYRRLPEGWETRSQSPDFRRRREAAQQRALDHGAAPPPPGWTFVQPFLKGNNQASLSDGTDRERRFVKSRGIVALVLAFRGNQDIDQDD